MKPSIISLLVASTLFSAACSDNKEAANSSTGAAKESVKVVDNLENKINEALQESNLSKLYDETTSTFFNKRAMSATAFGLDDSQAGGYFQNRVEDYSPATEIGLRKTMHQLAAQIDEGKVDTVQGEENRKVMANLARYFAGPEGFEFGYIDSWMGQTAFMVSQINGPVIDFPTYLQDNHPITNEQDAKDYVERLKQFDSLIGSINEKLLYDAEKGWIPPKVIVEGAIGFLEGFVAKKENEHALYVNLENKLNKLELADETKAALLKQAHKGIYHSVYPAYKNLTKTMRELLPKATTESGIWAQPGGAEFYRDAVKKLGDTDLSPDEIHNVGLAEVERISQEMDVLLNANGYKKGSVGARMTALSEELRFIYEDSDAGRQQLLDDLNGMLAEINEVMPSQFATVPPYDVEIRRIPVERQEGAPGGQYTTPSLDGTQPGIYWINLRDMKANPKFDLKTLTYHEANPGHHWQIALNLSQESLPLLRRLAPYNAYVEGWALYSERVAWEMGMYKDDPFGDLGRLKAELFRAVRLVVDTGLHYKKWSREEAIKYMAETTGTAQSDVVSEIERYMAWPGQALGYKLGMINILKQRDIAREALGEKFEIKEFHDLILLGGAVPMSVLNEKIAAWIVSKQ